MRLPSATLRDVCHIYDCTVEGAVGPYPGPWFSGSGRLFVALVGEAREDAPQIVDVEFAQRTHVPAVRTSRHVDVVWYHHNRRPGRLGRGGASHGVLDRKTLRRVEAQQLRRAQVRVGRGLGMHHLVPAYGHREVVAANAVQRALGEVAPGVGDQSQRYARRDELLEKLLGAWQPRQPRFEQLTGVVVQPVGGFGHRRRLRLQTEFGVDGPHDALRRTAHRRLARLRAQYAAETRAERVHRYVPELFGVDKRAVHVPEHRLHAPILSWAPASVKS